MVGYNYAVGVVSTGETERKYPFWKMWNNSDNRKLRVPRVIINVVQLLLPREIPRTPRARSFRRVLNKLQPERAGMRVETENNTELLVKLRTHVPPVTIDYGVYQRSPIRWQYIKWMANIRVPSLLLEISDKYFRLPSPAGGGDRNRTEWISNKTNYFFFGRTTVYVTFTDFVDYNGQVWFCRIFFYRKLFRTSYFLWIDINNKYFGNNNNLIDNFLFRPLDSESTDVSIFLQIFSIYFLSDFPLLGNPGYVYNVSELVTRERPSLERCRLPLKSASLSNGQLEAVKTR